MKYKKIIEEILEVYNINASEFAEKIDVQRSSISHILSGRNKPSLDFLIKIKEVFPELRWDYLLLGQKPMTLSEESSINKRESEKEISRSADDEQEEVSLPLQAPSLFDKITEDVDPNNTESEIDNPKTKKLSKIVKKIVWFYTDNSFEVFEA